VTLEIKTADELADPRLDPRYRARRSGPRADVLRAVYRLFVERAGPVPIGEVEQALAARAPEATREALAALDADDLIVLADDRIVTAYPFTGEPTPFAVDLPGGGRHACCAIDALGVAPMLGRAVVVRSRCHHCGEPLELAVAPGGPVAGPGEVPAAIMVWVADPGCATERRTSSL
jgi:hypothetical protein